MRKNFTRVRDKENDKEGSVADILAAQITVDYDDGTFGFLLFKDLGVTWEILQ